MILDYEAKDFTNKKLNFKDIEEVISYFGTYSVSSILSEDKKTNTLHYHYSEDNAEMGLFTYTIEDNKEFHEMVFEATEQEEQTSKSISKLEDWNIQKKLEHFSFVDFMDSLKNKLKNDKVSLNITEQSNNSLLLNSISLKRDIFHEVDNWDDTYTPIYSYILDIELLLGNNKSKIQFMSKTYENEKNDTFLSYLEDNPVKITNMLDLTPKEFSDIQIIIKNFQKTFSEFNKYNFEAFFMEEGSKYTVFGQDIDTSIISFISSYKQEKKFLEKNKTNTKKKPKTPTQ